MLTCGFALRNFVSLPEVLGEMARVLVPGGRLAIVEVDRRGVFGEQGEVDTHAVPRRSKGIGTARPDAHVV